MTTKEFEEKLEKLNIKKADFVEIAKVKKGTIYNWGTSRIIKGEKETIAIPDWVEPFLDYYEKARKYEDILRLLER